jgi:hypothetical protein
MQRSLAFVGQITAAESGVRPRETLLRECVQGAIPKSGNFDNKIGSSKLTRSAADYVLSCVLYAYYLHASADRRSSRDGKNRPACHRR